MDAINVPKNGTTLDDVLVAVNSAFTKVEERIEERFAEVKSDIVEIKSDIVDLKADVHELNTTMVTKDYLDRKFQESKDDAMKIARKTNDKIVLTVRTLRDKAILSQAEAQPILTMEPFPVPR